MISTHYLTHTWQGDIRRGLSLRFTTDPLAPEIAFNVSDALDLQKHISEALDTIARTKHPGPEYKSSYCKDGIVHSHGSLGNELHEPNHLSQSIPLWTRNINTPRLAPPKAGNSALIAAPFPSSLLVLRASDSRPTDRPTINRANEPSFVFVLSRFVCSLFSRRFSRSQIVSRLLDVLTALSRAFSNHREGSLGFISHPSIIELTYIDLPSTLQYRDFSIYGHYFSAELGPPGRQVTATEMPRLQDTGHWPYSTVSSTGVLSLN